MNRIQEIMKVMEEGLAEAKAEGNQRDIASYEKFIKELKSGKLK